MEVSLEPVGPLGSSYEAVYALPPSEADRRSEFSAPTTINKDLQLIVRNRALNVLCMFLNYIGAPKTVTDGVHTVSASKA